MLFISQRIPVEIVAIGVAGVVLSSISNNESANGAVTNPISRPLIISIPLV